MSNDLASMAKALNGASGGSTRTTTRTTTGNEGGAAGINRSGHDRRVRRTASSDNAVLPLNQSGHERRLRRAASSDGSKIVLGVEIPSNPAPPHAPRRQMRRVRSFVDDPAQIAASTAAAATATGGDETDSPTKRRSLPRQKSNELSPHHRIESSSISAGGGGGGDGKSSGESRRPITRHNSGSGGRSIRGSSAAPALGREDHRSTSGAGVAGSGGGSIGRERRRRTSTAPTNRTSERHDDETEVRQGVPLSSPTSEALTSKSSTAARRALRRQRRHSDEDDGEKSTDEDCHPLDGDHSHSGDGGSGSGGRTRGSSIGRRSRSDRGDGSAEGDHNNNISNTSSSGGEGGRTRGSSTVRRSRSFSAAPTTSQSVAEVGGGVKGSATTEERRRTRGDRTRPSSGRRNAGSSSGSGSVVVEESTRTSTGRRRRGKSLDRESSITPQDNNDDDDNHQEPKRPTSDQSLHRSLHHRSDGDGTSEAKKDAATNEFVNLAAKRGGFVPSGLLARLSAPDSDEEEEDDEENKSKNTTTENTTTTIPTAPTSQNDKNNHPEKKKKSFALKAFQKVAGVELKTTAFSSAGTAVATTTIAGAAPATESKAKNKWGGLQSGFNFIHKTKGKAQEHKSTEFKAPPPDNGGSSAEDSTTITEHATPASGPATSTAPVTATPAIINADASTDDTDIATTTTSAPSTNSNQPSSAEKKWSGVKGSMDFISRVKSKVVLGKSGDLGGGGGVEDTGEEETVQKGINPQADPTDREGMKVLAKAKPSKWAALTNKKKKPEANFGLMMSVADFGMDTNDLTGNGHYDAQLAKDTMNAHPDTVQEDGDEDESDEDQESNCDYGAASHSHDQEMDHETQLIFSPEVKRPQSQSTIQGLDDGSSEINSIEPPLVREEEPAAMVGVSQSTNAGTTGDRVGLSRDGDQTYVGAPGELTTIDDGGAMALGREMSSNTEKASNHGGELEEDYNDVNSDDDNYNNVKNEAITTTEKQDDGITDEAGDYSGPFLSSLKCVQLKIDPHAVRAAELSLSIHGLSKGKKEADGTEVHPMDKEGRRAHEQSFYRGLPFAISPRNGSRKSTSGISSEPSSPHSQQSSGSGAVLRGTRSPNGHRQRRRSRRSSRGGEDIISPKKQPAINILDVLEAEVSKRRSSNNDTNEVDGPAQTTTSSVAPSLENSEVSVEDNDQENSEGWSTDDGSELASPRSYNDDQNSAVSSQPNNNDRWKLPSLDEPILEEGSILTMNTEFYKDSHGASNDRAGNNKGGSVVVVVDLATEYDRLVKEVEESKTRTQEARTDVRALQQEIQKLRLQYGEVERRRQLARGLLERRKIVLKRVS
jgi:hypothetical protein